VIGASRILRRARTNRFAIAAVMERLAPFEMAFAFQLAHPGEPRVHALLQFLRRHFIHVAATAKEVEKGVRFTTHVCLLCVVFISY
jgi:hypothetical protein